MADTLPTLVKDLLNPSAYPYSVERIDLIQTHISYVFLAGDFVYKVKKPVDFGFLNYSTLARRRYYCGREVALNRRLCDDVYLGVIPIRDEGRSVVVEGKRGKIVEYAVKMRRLPEDRMMHNLLESNEVTPEMVGAIAEKLVPFHQSAATSPAIARFGDWAVRYNCAENVRQWQPFIGRTITAGQDAALRAYLEAFYARKADVMQRRVEELRVRECHSDLRSDAVAFTCADASPDCICILDCVEFNRRIMMIDTARDVSFLAMDLEYRGHPALAAIFFARYKELAGDPDLDDVYPYYACYNACVRGKVESFLLDDPEVSEGEKKAAARRAKRYFDLATDYVRSLPPAFLVITCGLSASGKSTIARALATEIDAEIISSDIVRKTLLGMDPEEPAAAEYRAGIYSAEMTARTYQAMLNRAREQLLAGHSVILDATFLRRADRTAAAKLARETGAQFACILTRANEASVRKTMAARERSAGVSDARWDTYIQQKRRFQKPGEVPPNRLITLDVPAGRAGTKRVLKSLRALSPLSFPD